jgi:hypothetical protein
MIRTWTNKSPGVYREEIFRKPESELPTGVAGFVGFAEPTKRETHPVVALHHPEDFGYYFKAGENDCYLAEAVRNFFTNGGVRCHVAYAAPTPTSTEKKEALITAVQILAPLDDLDVIAVPHAVTLEPDDMAELQGWLLKHCAEQGDRFAILDTPEDTTPEKARDHRGKILRPEVGGAAMNGALYYPWVKSGTSNGPVPPCGHVAGIFARSDARVGVFKAPANEELLGTVDLETEVTGSMQAELNPEGINCLRAMPGRGIRVWGARTLSKDPQWRYVNVRRLFITVRRWIDANMGWAVFEPNGRPLWMRIERELGEYLRGLWRFGAVRGRTPEQAFYVKCDNETNPSGGPAEQVVTEIGLAPTAPAEFVVVRVVHRTPLTAEYRDE